VIPKELHSAIENATSRGETGPNGQPFANPFRRRDGDVQPTELQLRVRASLEERRARAEGARTAGGTAGTQARDGLQTACTKATDDPRAGTLFTREPRPLPAHAAESPQFDVALLPGLWRRWIGDSSERLQCPPDYAAAAALVSASSLVGDRVRVRPKVHDLWFLTPNTWG